MKLLVILFLSSCLLQCFYYILFFKQLRFHRPSKIIKGSQIGVSIVVCARNEGDQLKKNIPYWLNQLYEPFELIIVNDRSTDHTKLVLDKFLPDNRLKVIENNRDTFTGKRAALQSGILKAQYDFVLLTDADCIPATTNWISEMMSAMGDNKIVLGVGVYTNGKNAGLSNIVQYETTLTYMQYLTAATMGRPYAGVGRNLLYDKSIFDGGFPTSPDGIISGDDDMWLKVLANGKNTTVCINTSALTYSMPSANFSGWLKQKRRHYSTGKYYSLGTKFYTAGFLSSKMLYYLSFFLLIILTGASWSYVGIFLFTILFMSVITSNLQYHIEKRSQRYLIPILDIISIFFMVIVGIFATFSPPKKWN